MSPVMSVPESASAVSAALPIHPTTGLRALGVTRRGPIWPVLGGSVDSGAAGGGADGGAGADGAGAGGADGGAAGGGADGGAAGGNSGGGGSDEFKSEHSKAAVLADLTSTRAENATLKARIQELEDKGKPAEQLDAEAAQRKAEEDRKRDTDLAAAVRESNQFKAAAEVGLTLKQAARLKGDTLDEMIADAKAFKAELADAAGAQQRTDGAGASDSGSAADTATPGVGRMTAYFASQQQK